MRMSRSLLVAASLLAVATSAPALANSYYMVVNSGSKYIMLFDRTTGQVVNDQWIDLFNASGSPGTIKDAIQVLNEIWVADSTAGAIYRFKADENNPAYIGTYTGLPGVRGLAFDGQSVYASAGGGSNFAGVYRLNRGGTILGQFNTNMNSPFDVLVAGNELLVSDFNNDNITRYQPDGTYIGELVPRAAVGLRKPEQITFNNASNLLVAGFSPPIGLYIFNATTGAQINVYPVGAPRGVAQLGNGDYIFTDGVGLSQYNPTTNVTNRTYGGAASSSGQYINLVDFDATGCPADFNGDGFIDFTDFDDFVGAFEAGTANADFNGDGFLDFTDFDDFVGAFETGC